MPKHNLFKKMMLLILVMLIPIMVLYFYSNKINSEVLRSELNKSNVSQLTFFQNQVNANVDMLTLWPNLLMHDPDIFSLKDLTSNSDYLNLDEINLVKRIQTKLGIQENSSNWKSSLFIYSPELHRVVSVNDAKGYSDEELSKRLKSGWQLNPVVLDGEERYIFSLFTAYPYSAVHNPEEVNLIIEVQYDSRNIQNMLDKFKSDGRKDPFYYKKEDGVIYNRTANKPLIEEFVQQYEQNQLQGQESFTIQLDGERYLVSVVHSDHTGWDLIDYMPLSEIMEPITRSNLLFYFSVGCLLLMSCLVSYMLYAQIQVPLKELIHGFQKLRNEDYSVRLDAKGNGEFGFVFTRFNWMVDNIQDLFERVYLERIHVREARLKQLQSQINPHFFYNCFSFISSMAKLNNTRAVVAMSENLSRYYRYTTRQERDLVPLKDEIEFVTNYLEIQTMRMNRLQYTIALEEGLHNMLIPKLLIQPLVENAMLHGIESSSSANQVYITVKRIEDEVIVVVEDNGKGLTQEGLEELQHKLTLPMTEEMGCGMWNVHQRVLLTYGEGAEMSLSASPYGGLRVTLRWNDKRDRNGSDLRGELDDRNIASG